MSANAKFCSECGARATASTIIGKLLEEPISELSISERLKEHLKPRFATVGAIVQALRDELMTIKYIKEVRSRIIKNAADEFISG
jgi:molybdopterin converting factor small subunit